MPVSSANKQNTHAHEEKLQVVAVVARLRERIVQARNALGTPQC